MTTSPSILRANCASHRSISSMLHLRPCRVAATVLIAVAMCASLLPAKPFYTELETPLTCPRLAAREPSTVDPVGRANSERSTNTEATITDIASPPVPVAGKSVYCNGIRLQDEIVFISTRQIGCVCDPDVLRSCLRCERYAVCDEHGGRQWQPEDLTTVLAEHRPETPTVIYVHGNQISRSQDKQRGLYVYRKLAWCASSDRPIRMIIFSWPSSKVPGPLKDAQLKAARTRPVGCQLAWVVDQMPGDLPLGLIGYSYGARVVTGALHVLGGGHLGGLGLQQRLHPRRSPVHAVLIASAMHAHWLGPGNYHGQAMSQVDRMLLINNCSDPVMRWYHLSVRNAKPQALGLAGPTYIGPDGRKVCNRDVSRYVGPKHNEFRYLSSPGTAYQLWEWGVVKHQ